MFGWQGPHPEDGEELIVEDNIPEGVRPSDLDEEPQLMAPGIDPALIKEFAMRLGR